MDIWVNAILAAAKAEVEEARRTLGDDTEAFRRWAEEHLKALRSRITVASFKEWVAAGGSRLELAIDEIANDVIAKHREQLSQLGAP